MYKVEVATQRAIEVATASMADLAEEAGLHQTTVARWHAGLTGVRPVNAVKLSRAVRDRALRMLEAAARLEALAEAYAKGADP